VNQYGGGGGGGTLSSAEAPISKHQGKKKREAGERFFPRARRDCRTPLRRREGEEAGEGGRVTLILSVGEGRLKFIFVSERGVRLNFEPYFTHFPPLTR